MPWISPLYFIICLYNMSALLLITPFTSANVFTQELFRNTSFMLYYFIPLNLIEALKEGIKVNEYSFLRGFFNYFLLVLKYMSSPIDWL